MSKEKRGGARLSQSKPPKKKAPHHSDALTPPPDSAASEHTSQQGKKLNSKGLKVTIIVVVSFIAVLLILFAVYKSWAKLPEVPPLPTLPAFEESATPDPVTGVVPSYEPIVSDRKENFYTFLVVGKDTGGGGNTDTMMLAAYDIPNQKLSVMSLPRDTMVDPRHPDRNHKLNAVWNLGLYYADKGSKKQGQDYLKEAVGDLTGIYPDFYVAVNWEAFGRLVDAIGGVEFEVPFDMKYKDPTQNLVIDQPAGRRRLSGDDAMQVVRWRHNNSGSVQYADADLGRIRTQQNLMKEIVRQCLQIKNVTKINEFAEIFTEEVETDLTVGNLVAFAERAILGGLTMDNVTFCTLPVSGVSVKGESYVQVKPEEMLALLNESFNPYKNDLEFANLNVIQYSSSSGYYTYKGSGKSASSTSPKASAAPSAAPTSSGKPTVTPKPSATVTPKPSNSTKPGETATPKPSSKPSATPAPSRAPSAEPSASETPEPSGSTAPSESAGPSSDPETSAEPSPSEEPTEEPSVEPSPASTPEPTPESTPEPTPEPTPMSEPTMPPVGDNGLPPGVPMD